MADSFWVTDADEFLVDENGDFYFDDYCCCLCDEDPDCGTCATVPPTVTVAINAQQYNPALGLCQTNCGACCAAFNGTYILDRTTATSCSWSNCFEVSTDMWVYIVAGLSTGPTRWTASVFEQACPPACGFGCYGGGSIGTAKTLSGHPDCPDLMQCSGLHALGTTSGPTFGGGPLCVDEGGCDAFGTDGCCAPANITLTA